MTRLLSRRQVPIAVALLLASLALAVLVALVGGWWSVALVLVAQAAVVVLLLSIRNQVGRLTRTMPETVHDTVVTPLLGRLEDDRARSEGLLTSLRSRLDALERDQAGLAGSLTRLEQDEAAARQDAAAFQQHVRQSFLNAVTDAWSLHNLVRLVDVQGEFPPAGGWAATPQTLLAMVAEVQSRDGEVLVVECGSGTSTVWLAATMRQRGSGRVVAVEHEEEFAEATREHLRRNGLQAWAEVRCAPLTDVEVGDRTFRWYDPACFEDLGGIDVLLVDGPPWRTGDLARYPALPVLAGRLGEGALVVLDDVDRDQERATARRWVEEDHEGRRVVRRRRLDRAQVFEVL